MGTMISSEDTMKDRLGKLKNKKIRNELLQGYIKKHISEKNLELITNCGSFLEFWTTETQDKSRLTKANYCKNRFCPMCAWRKSLKDSLRNRIILEHLGFELNDPYRFLFLTLTIPNVRGDELDNSIKHLYESFKRLQQRKAFKDLSQGTIRKLEVTYQSHEFVTKENLKKYKKSGLKIGDKLSSYDTYHPHLHVLIAVNRSYFTDSKIYLSQKEWLKMWQETTKDNTITQVDVKAVKELSKVNDMIASDKVFKELSKYTAKDKDYLANGEDVFDCFYRSLKGKRIINYSGVFKTAKKLFHEGYLDHLKENQDIIDEFVYKIIYFWKNKDYERSEKLTLITDEEKQKAKKYYEALYEVEENDF